MRFIYLRCESIVADTSIDYLPCASADAKDLDDDRRTKQPREAPVDSVLAYVTARRCALLSTQKTSLLHLVGASASWTNRTDRAERRSEAGVLELGRNGALNAAVAGKSSKSSCIAASRLLKSRCFLSGEGDCIGADGFMEGVAEARGLRENPSEKEDSALIGLSGRRTKKSEA